MSIQEEIWKDIQGYEGRYQVSNYGNVKRLGVSKFLKKQVWREYYKVHLFLNGIVKTFRVNRLVAIAFVPNPDNKPQVNHKDGNKQNNIPENLEWVNQFENMQHAGKMGLHNVSGESNKLSKLKTADVLLIRQKLSNKQSRKSIANEFGVSVSTIACIANKKVWKHI